jgi:hypothetical protein
MLHKRKQAPTCGSNEEENNIERTSAGSTAYSFSVYLHSVVLVSVHKWLCWVTVRVKESENWRLVRFWKRTDRWCSFSWSVCDKTATLLGLLRATVSKVVPAYTNHGKATSEKWNSGRKATLTERDSHTLRRIVPKTRNYRRTCERTAKLNIHLEDPVRHDMRFTNSVSTVRLQFLNLWLLKVMLAWVNDHVTIMKPGYQTIGNARVIWSDESSFTMFATSGNFTFGEHPRKPTIGNAWSQQWHTGGCVMVCAALSWYGILLVPLLPFMTQFLQGVRGEVG